MTYRRWRGRSSGARLARRHPQRGASRPLALLLLLGAAAGGGLGLAAGWAARLALPMGGAAPQASALLSAAAPVQASAAQPDGALHGAAVAPAALLAPEPQQAAVGSALAGVVEHALARLPSGRAAFERLQPGSDGHLLERVVTPEAGAALDISYSFHPELSSRVFSLLRQHRVGLGHVIVANARSGRLLVYASTDPEGFPPTGLYPAASLVKVVTAAATLRRAPDLIDHECRFRGSPYRLSRALLTPPLHGASASFRRALATSNNQCFAQLAVNALGPAALLEEIAAFGWLRAPAPGHAAGRVTTGSDAYAIGMLGSGLGGSEITPLHAAQLALLLASGRIEQPYWIERVAAQGRELALPAREGWPVLGPAELLRLRELLVETTRSGTARRAFQHRGRPLLAPLSVAGKTGSLTGHTPPGRYEWFVGVAPAEDPQIAIAVLTVHQGMWWRSASQLSAEILRQMFCPGGVCSPAAGERWLRPVAGVSVPAAKPGD